MPILLAVLLFLTVTVLGAMLGTKLWVRPKEAIERVTGTGPVKQEEMPIHPSLVFHEIVKKLGTMLPVSPKDAGVIQRRMIRAGIRNPNAMRYLFGAKVMLGVTLPLLMTAAVASTDADPTHKAFAIIAAAAAGFFSPNEKLSIRANRRQK
jgi:hypothetical protein